MPAEQSSSTDYRGQRLRQLENLRAEGIEPFPVVSGRTISNADLQARFSDLAPGEFSDCTETIAGRVQSLRNSGMFIDLFDGTAKTQVYTDLKSAESSTLVQMENLSLGDFIAVRGRVRRTPRGELTVDCHALTFLAKSLLPPPEKYHGLSDVETRYRKRHLDIIGNVQSRNVLLARFKLISAIRRFLEDRGFLEVETPMLQPIYGGASARPFMTHHNSLDMDLYLRIAPELYLKRLLVGGLSDKLFELNRNFRNEGLSTRHNPEFTMLEVYQAYTDRDGMMELVEAMIRHATRTVRASGLVNDDAPMIDFEAPFRIVSMIDSASEAVGADFRAAPADKLQQALSARLGQPVDPALEWGQLVEMAFEEFVEPHLSQPTHVIDFPASISPLAKPSPVDPRIADRFETFAGGMEIANAFSEMNDPLLQRQVLERQAGQGRRGEIAPQVDEAFLEALEAGMPPAGGLGMGIDRLTMLAVGVSSIREVIAFPLLRPGGH